MSAPPTKQDLDDLKKLVDEEKQIEASKSLPSRVWDAYQNHRERHPYIAPSIGVVLVISAIVAAFKFF